MLHRRGIHRRADALEQRVALGARIAEDADLDELVREQRDVDLMQHRRRQSVLPDEDDRMEMVRLGAQRAACGRRQCIHPQHSTVTLTPRSGGHWASPAV